ncbi:hypothetical protein H1P_3410007 [Hyella patelloides LEGE 07179]|uniref:Uncharacterized protein n=1 Tax=Hyella patelloides LEGE 07179 TaxID=945734 RepID=A0A563VVM4_9CYAN|nr:hypothetical protein [Hyella patelloides]VEP15524.1 hypothetical protein H1P_3410007 [Hyella patelloides LEGE 07179]
MVWTKEEQELIAILDSFLENCSQSDKFKYSNYHRFLQQILSVTNGEIAATRQYCEQILGFHKKKNKPQEENKISTSISIPQKWRSRKSQASPNQLISHSSPLKKSRQPKFKSSWTVLFLISTIVTVFFAAQKSPNIVSFNKISNLATLCPVSLIETAQTGIKNHDKLLLGKAIADIQQLRKKQADRLGIECEQALSEAQFIYAINFIASQGQSKQAVTYLCEISPKYYQNQPVIPWFTRWSNSNQEFKQWLTQYKTNNNCPVASYLE